MKKSLLLFAALLLSSAVHAQSYPNRPVRVIIPWPPGQATDLAARLVGEKLSQQLGQPFVMENRPGAGGSIGTDVVVKAAPDGYTLLAASSGPISIMPNLQKTPYEPLKDLAPVSLIATVHSRSSWRPIFRRRTPRSSWRWCAPIRASTPSPPPARAPRRTCSPSCSIRWRS
jgi:tripartite-type tricarboxylate transporter receptor subunit TctC